MARKNPDGSRGETAISPITSSVRQLFTNGRWALDLTWATNRGLTTTLVVSYFLQSSVPAAQALAARGLIDSAVRQLRSGSTSLRPMVVWLIFAFVATLVEGLNRLAQDFTMRRLEDDLNLELNSRILTHAGNLDVSFFENPSSQDVLYRANQNPAGNVARFVGGILNVISNLFQIVSLLAIVVVIEPLVLIVIVPAAIPYLRFQWNLTRDRYELERSRATKRRWTQYFVSGLTDSTSVPEARILDLAPMMIQKFRTLMTEFRDQDHRLLLRSVRAAALFSWLATVALYALFARVAVRVLKGSCTMGDLAIFGAAAARLRSTVEAEINGLTYLLEQMLHVSDLQEFFAAKPALISASTASVPQQYRGELEFENVSFTYDGSTEPALNDISLKIRAGETIALVGENGSGKTTFVKLLVRFYDPTAGCVRLDGQDLREIAPQDLHSRVSFVFQNFGRYEASIAENIGYGDWRRLVGASE